MKMRAQWAALIALGVSIVVAVTVYHMPVGYVMNLSGQTITIGTWMAGAGGLFALFSPVLGWLGVAVTGSDTSSNALFGTLQVSAAQSAHLPPVLLAAANSSGGVPPNPARPYRATHAAQPWAPTAACICGPESAARPFRLAIGYWAAASRNSKRLPNGSEA